MLGWLKRLFRRETNIGTLGENAAAQYLKSLGWRILDRNVRVPMGEADIVAESADGYIVLVEVKARVIGARAKPRPEQQVGAKKAAKLRAILSHLTVANAWQDRKKAIDIVAVDWLGHDTPPVIRHFRHAIKA